MKESQNSVESNVQPSTFYMNLNLHFVNKILYMNHPGFHRHFKTIENGLIKNSHVQQAIYG